MTALAEAFNRGERETLPRVIGGRYGLSSKEFGPECVLAVFAELREAKPKPRFTVGIYDDVTNLSLPLPENTLPSNAKLEALFYGLGSDGSVSATKNNIKIIGNSTPWYAQGYFVYDSKSGRTDRLPPARQRTPDPLGIPDFSGGFCWLSPAPVH